MTKTQIGKHTFHIPKHTLKIPTKIITLALAVSFLGTTAFASKHQVTTRITKNNETSISLELLTTTIQSPFDLLSTKANIESIIQPNEGIDSFQISSTATKTFYYNDFFHTHIELNPSFKIEDSDVSSNLRYKIVGDAIHGLISYDLNEMASNISVSKPIALFHKNSRIGTTWDKENFSFWLSSYVTRELTAFFSYKIPLNETSFSFYLSKDDTSLFNETAISTKNISDLFKISIGKYFNEGNLTILGETNFSDYSFSASLDLKNGIESNLVCSNNSLSGDIGYSNKNFSVKLQAETPNSISLKISYTLQDSTITFEVGNNGTSINTSYSW